MADTPPRTQSPAILSGQTRGRNEACHKPHCVGIMMLGLQEPRKIVGPSKRPLTVPEAPCDCETDGQRSYTPVPCATLEDV